MSEKLFSRRDFMKLASLVTGGAILTACTPKLKDAQGLNSVTDTRPTTLTPTSPSETLNPSLTPDVWKLSLSQRVELMREPELFTELQGENTKKIITLQFDGNEYKRLNRDAFYNNSCGQSVLATIVKMCGFLNTGKVSDITIADIYTSLDKVAFTDIKGYTAKCIVWDDEMSFVGLPDALKILAPQLISKTEFLTPNYGVRYTRIVPQANWSDVLSNAQSVCEGGGFVIIGCLKHGGGHILLGTNIKADGTAMIVDSYSGTAQNVFLKTYFDSRVDPSAEYLGVQPGLLHMISITPKLNSSS